METAMLAFGCEWLLACCAGHHIDNLILRFLTSIAIFRARMLDQHMGSPGVNISLILNSSKVSRVFLMAPLICYDKYFDVGYVVEIFGFLPFPISFWIPLCRILSHLRKAVLAYSLLSSGRAAAYKRP